MSSPEAFDLYFEFRLAFIDWPELRIWTDEAGGHIYIFMEMYIGDEKMSLIRVVSRLAMITSFAHIAQVMAEDSEKVWRRDYEAYVAFQQEKEHESVLPYYAI